MFGDKNKLPTLRLGDSQMAWQRTGAKSERWLLTYPPTGLSKDEPTHQVEISYAAGQLEFMLTRFDHGDAIEVISRFEWSNRVRIAAEHGDKYDPEDVIPEHAEVVNYYLDDAKRRFAAMMLIFNPAIAC